MKRYVHKPCGARIQELDDYSLEYCPNCLTYLQTVDLFELPPSFYDLYLAEHSNRWNRLLHLAGLICSVYHVVSCLVFGHYWQVILAPAVAYGGSWLGHLVQWNWPLSFRHPVQSAVAYWRMIWEMIHRV